MYHVMLQQPMRSAAHSNKIHQSLGTSVITQLLWICAHASPHILTCVTVPHGEMESPTHHCEMIIPIRRLGQEGMTTLADKRLHWHNVKNGDISRHCDKIFLVYDRVPLPASTLAICHLPAVSLRPSLTTAPTLAAIFARASA